VLLGSLGGLANSRRAQAALGEIFSVVIIGLTRAARVVPSHALRLDPMPDASEK
jgi:hypothetical protein